MNKIYINFLLVLFLIFQGNKLHAQVGVYDPTFGNGGKIFQLFPSEDVKPTSVILQTDGKIVVAGGGGDFFSGVFKIVRYNPDGNLDTGFGTGGVVTFNNATGNDLLESAIIQPDGKIVGGGIINVFDSITQQTNSDFYLFRLQANGSVDSSFGTNGFVYTDLSSLSNDFLQKILLKPDGKILAGGFGLDSVGGNLYGLVQFKDNGSRDSTFGTNGITVLSLNQQDEGKGSLGLLPNGQIIAATNVVSPSGFYEFGLLRFNANGSLDSSFGTTGVQHLSLNYFHSIIGDMAIQPDGKIVLTGQTDVNFASGIAVVRVDSNGAYDSTFGMNGVVRTHISDGTYTPETGNTISIQPDGKIIIGATLDNAINSMDANFAVVRYLPNGVIDQNFGRQGIIITDFNEFGDFSTTSLLQPDGKYVLVGSAESGNYETGFGIVRYLSDARFYYNTLKASVFYDDNGNGVKDINEEFFSNAVLSAVRGSDTITITSSAGIFSSEIDTGQYIIRPVQPSIHIPYYDAAPALDTVTNTTYFNTDSVSFAMKPIAGMRDLFAYVIPLHPARPGFAADYVIMYGNNGTDTVASGNLKFVPDSFVNVTSSNPSATSANGDTLVWNYVNLYPRDTAFILIEGTIQPPPAVNIDDTLSSIVIVEPSDQDQHPMDNVFKLSEDVTGSFDPNDKSESHAGQLTAAQLSSGEYLQYMIRFQNTGTDTAFNISIRDTLENTLDWSTMQMLVASHPYKLMRENGICVWTFNNIQLVDSNRNEPKSHGYVVFRIKPKSSLVPGNTIINSAAIYFDYNLPVFTNTEITKIMNDGEPTPVTLLSFTAENTGSTNELNWRAINEENVERYEVERSADGNAYSNIGNIQSQPPISGSNDYAFNDVSPLSPTNYYRLRIIERNGGFIYSDVRMLTNAQTQTYSLYTNPIKDVLQVKINSVGKATLHAQVISYDGRRLQSVIWDVQQGSVTKAINTTALPRGTYFLNIITLANESQQRVENRVIKFEKL